MNICHCLFWIENNKITSVLNTSGGLEIMKFGGNETIEFTDEFWECWRDYSGFLTTSLTDFCFVYDEAPCIAESLKDRECPPCECVWNRNKVQKVAELMGIVQPTLIFNKNGVRIAQAGSFRNSKQEDIISLTAVYRNSENEIKENESVPAELTPLIEEMLEKLKKYDEEKLKR